jgi:hypothetical protein
MTFGVVYFVRFRMERGATERQASPGLASQVGQTNSMEAPTSYLRTSAFA